MLTRIRQLAAKIESQEGIEDALSASDARIQAENPVIDVDPPVHERNPVGSSLSKIGDVPGKRVSRLTFSLRLRGSGESLVEPQWFKFLKACGWKVNALYKITIGAVTGGPFKHGETITGDISGATGRVVIDTSDGTTTLYFIPISGAFQTGETLTGSVSGATADTSSGPQEAGKEFKPISRQSLVPSLSAGTFEDSVKKTMKGARGKVKFNFRVSEPVTLDFEFSGAFSGTVDSPLLEGIVHEQTKPPTFLNAYLWIDSLKAKLSELEIDWANVLSVRDDVNEPGGVFSFLIADRKPLGSFNPEMVEVSNHDFFGKWLRQEEMILNFQVGEVWGNKFWFYAPKVQYTKVADEDRDGIMSARTSFSLNGSLEPGDDELTILSL
jgi:hypothetical protein